MGNFLTGGKNMSGKYGKIAKVLWLIMMANIAVAIVKIVIGYLFHINSLSADGFHATTDSVSNIIGLIGIHYAAKPADKDHPYGHQKMETIAGFAIGFMLFGITIEIIYNAIRWFFYPMTPIINTESLIALGLTLAINIAISVSEYKIGVSLKSDVLISDSIHTRSDILISSGVILTMLAMKLGLPPLLDPIFSLVIAVFVFRSCVEIFRSCASVLTDRKVIDEDRIIGIVFAVDNGILDVHHVRSRGREDAVFIDLHVMIEGDTKVTEAHDLSHRIEDRLKEELQRNVEVMTHIEPDMRKKENG